MEPALRGRLPQASLPGTSRETMATESEIRIVLNFLADFQECSVCGARFRFGDLDCPHCGQDLEEILRHWAKTLVDALAAEGAGT